MNVGKHEMIKILLDIWLEEFYIRWRIKLWHYCKYVSNQIKYYKTPILKLQIGFDLGKKFVYFKAGKKEGENMEHKIELAAK